MAIVMWAATADIVAGDLDAAGIEPRDVDGLPGIVASPFLHAGFGHLIGNTIPFLVLGAAIAVGGLKRTLVVTAIVAIVGGVGTWLTAPSNTVVIGASGLVFGYATYLVARGIYSRMPLHFVGGLAVLAIYGSTLLVGLVPTPGVSWQGHLFGAVAALSRRGSCTARAPGSPIRRDVAPVFRVMLEVMATARPRVLLPAAAVAAGLVLGCGGSDGGRRRARPRPPRRRAARPSPPPRPHRRAPPRAGACGSCASAASAPVYVTAPPGDRRGRSSSSRAGGSWSCAAGASCAAPFLDISAQVTSGGEQGLLSMAFAPDYASSGRFYVYFTDDDGDQRVVEYRRASADRADAGSARLVLAMADSESNHNGGLLLFGPDGLLYIGTGDGGGGGDQHGPRGNAQNLGSLLGKILRIDPRPAGGRAYSVPRSNPFVGRSGARGEIYSYGLRNPWRFSFDRRTRDLSIGDVGQDEFEEIDFVRSGRGKNFGWRPFEGRRRYTAGESAPGHVRPVIQRFHSRGNCSITGGVVVRDRSVPGALRPLRVRRLLPRPDRVRAAAPRPRDRAADHAAAGPEPLLVRRGRPRPRLRDLAQRPGLPARRALIADAGAGRPRHRPAPRGQPQPVHARRHEHLGDRARPGVGGRPGPGARRSTSTRSPPRWRPAAARAGSRSRTTTTTTSRPWRRCASGSAAPGGGRALPRRRGARRRRRLRAAARARDPRPRRRPPRLRRGRRRLHRRRRARRGERVRHEPAGRVPRRAGAAARARPRGAVPGHGPPVWDPDAKLGEYLAHRAERERKLLAALEAGARTEDELLDAAWADAPAALRPAAALTLRAHAGKLRDEGRLPGGVG